MKGRHPTRRKPGDPCYDPQWSGVSYAPHAQGKHCPDCGENLHREGEGGDCFYCPVCDDYKRPAEGY